MKNTIIPIVQWWQLLFGQFFCADCVHAWHEAIVHGKQGRVFLFSALSGTAQKRKKKKKEEKVMDALVHITYRQ